MKVRSIEFLDRYGGPAWYIAASVFLVLGAGAVLILLASDGATIHRFQTAHLAGTLVMQSGLPAFLLASLVYNYRETHKVLHELQDQGSAPAVAQLHHRVTHLHGWAPFFVLLSTAYGAVQNIDTIQDGLAGVPLSPMDIGLFLGNCVVWVCIGILMSWRIPVSIELLKFGRSLNIDLYRSNHAHPMANLAAKDILIVAGAMAFMPLQSLDAEFRWENYAAGLYVGIPSAVILLFMPLLGLRRNIQERKRQRLVEIQDQINATDNTEVTTLELLSAHADRIKELPNWPFDMRLATKILGYSIIAPGAWVGAALVENLVDNLAN